MARRRAALAVAALLAVAPTRIAGAQGSAEREAAAEVLFEEARKLMAEGQYAEACPKFAESHRIDPGVGVLLFLGDCYEKNGQTASAWATFRSVVPMARAAGQADRVRTATERSEALKGRLSKLEIVVTGSTTDLVVLRDGSEVARALWGTAVAVDPGQRAIEARAPGRKAFRQTVEVPPGPTVVRVEVPELDTPDVSDSGQAGLEPSLVATNPYRSATTSEPEEETDGTQRTLGYAFSGAGVVGLAAAGVMGLMILDRQEIVRDLCPNKQCVSDEGYKAGEEGRMLVAAAITATAVGTVALGLGVYLLVTDRPSTTSERSSHRVARTTSFSSLNRVTGDSRALNWSLALRALPRTHGAGVELTGRF